MTGVGATPGRPSMTLGATFGSSSAIASIDARMPLPIAVRRPVVRLLIASTRACRSDVGGWITAANPLNATMPIWVSDACPLTNATAASSAAWRRVGSMSVEHMLPDTSMESRMVVWLLGTLRTTTGLASAMTSTAAPAANSANGRCRRRRRRPGAASRISARLEYRAAAGVQQDEHGDGQDERQQPEPEEGHRPTPRVSRQALGRASAVGRALAVDDVMALGRVMACALYAPETPRRRRSPGAGPGPPPRP